MKIFFSLSIFLFTALVAPAQEDQKAQKAVIDFFEGISQLDASRIQSQCTAGFQLLENGSIWTIDSLPNLVNRFKGHDYKRVNRFEFVKTNSAGKTAWISYHNYADITVDGKSIKRHWLESVVLNKEKGIWKIALMHSSRVM